MKFKVSSLNLNNKGQQVLRGLTKDAKAIVAFKVENDMMTLLCYTSSTYFKSTLEAYDCEDCNGDWKIVDGSMFKSVLSVLPTIEKELLFDSDILASSFVIKYGKSKANLKTTIGNSIQEETKFKVLTEISANYFMNSLNDVLKVVDPDPINVGGPVSCLHMFFNENDITMMGTNKIAIAEVKYPVSSMKELPKGKNSILLSGNEAKLLSRNTSANETWKIVITPSKFGFIDEEGSVSLVGITDESPIEYEPIKNLVAKKDGADGYNEILISSGSLKAAINNVLKLSQNSPSVTFSFEKDGLSLRNSTGDIFEVISDYDKEKIIRFGVNRAALHSLFSIWTEDIKFVIKDKPENSVLQIINMEMNTDEELIPIESTFIGVMTDEY